MDATGSAGLVYMYASVFHGEWDISEHLHRHFTSITLLQIMNIYTKTLHVHSSAAVRSSHFVPYKNSTIVSQSSLPKNTLTNPKTDLFIVNRKVLIRIPACCFGPSRRPEIAHTTHIPVLFQKQQGKQPTSLLLLTLHHARRLKCPTYTFLVIGHTDLFKYLSHLGVPPLFCFRFPFYVKLTWTKRFIP